jgi:medium-chain acyl-[acyl-carrier-protein] hydrolase
MTPVPANPWLTILRPNRSAKIRLICIPYAGGGPQMFRNWPALLPVAEVVAVNLPGRGRRIGEPPFTSLVPLARALSRALGSLCGSPFAFFGHSMGALIAYETARQLRRDYGIRPVHLFVSGAFAPHLPDPNPLHGLSDKEFLEEVRKLGGMPEEVLASTELMELLLPTLRADFTVAETYTCGLEEPLSCPITAFGGTDDPLATPAEVSCWPLHTDGRSQIHMYRGGHFFLESALPQIVDVLALELQAG